MFNILRKDNDNEKNNSKFEIEINRGESDVLKMDDKTLLEYWINDYNLNKENNIIKYNFMLIKYHFITTSIRKHLRDNPYSGSIEDAAAVDEIVHRCCKIDILYLFLHQMNEDFLTKYTQQVIIDDDDDGDESGVNAIGKIYKLLLNIVLNRKYTSSIHQPLSKSVGFDPNAKDSKIVCNFGDINRIKIKGFNVKREPNKLYGLLDILMFCLDDRLCCKYLSKQW